MEKIRIQCPHRSADSQWGFLGAEPPSERVGSLVALREHARVKEKCVRPPSASAAR